MNHKFRTRLSKLLASSLAYGVFSFPMAVAPVHADAGTTPADPASTSTVSTSDSITAGQPASYAASTSTSDLVDVQLLGINDFHGHLDYTKTTSSGNLGGAKYLAAYLKQKQAANPNTLLVHAGDAVGASNLESSLAQEEPSIQFLNKMGFSVGTIGNHELDHGTDEMLRLIHGGKNPVTGNNFEGAGFPYVCANIVDKATQQPIVAPYYVKEIGGVKVGFIGVITMDTPNIVKQDGISTVDFIPQKDAVNKYVKELQAQGVHSIVVLDHSGKDDAVALAQQVDPDVDLIMGGHDHAGYTTDVQNNIDPNKKIKLIEAYSYGTAFSDVDLKIDPKTQNVTSVDASVQNVDQSKIQPDPEIAAMVQGFLDKIAPIRDQELGFTSADILKVANPSGESPLGDVIADAMKESMNSDFAFMNSGGIRDDLKAGKITYGNLFGIQPFGNVLVKLQTTGKDLRAFLETQFKTGKALGQIAGFKYTYDTTQPADHKIVTLTKEDGTPILDDQTYTITVNDFCWYGGDGFTMLKNWTKVDSGTVDIDAFVNYVKNHTPLTAPAQNRFQNVSAIGAGGNAGGTTTGDTLSLRILETTDIHSNIMNYDYYKDAQDDTVGLVETASLIKQERAEQPNNLLFDNGDLLQGTPLADYQAKNLKDGETAAVYKAMNLLNYDAATLGNHEFNYGLDYLARALKGTQIPYVNANVYNMDGTNKWDPYKILTKTFTDANGQQQTLKIGVIGFVTPQIMTWDKGNLDGKVKTQDIVETAKKFVPQMQAAGCDLIVALDHSGFSKDPQQGMDENTAYYLSQVPGIDAILFGHAHLVFPSADPTFAAPGVDAVKGTINGVPAVEAASFGSDLGEIDLSLAKTNGKWKVANSQSRVLPVYDSKAKKALVTPDSIMVDAVKNEHQATLDYIRGPVGTTTAPINSFFALVQDDPSIQIVTNAQKWYAEQQVKGTQYAGLPILSVGAPFKAGGRQGANYYTNLPAGTIAVKNVSDLYLYPNTVKIVKVKGSQVKEWLERSAGQFNQIDPNKTDEQQLIDTSFPTYNFDVIDGVTYQVDVTQPSRYSLNGQLANPAANRIKNLQYNGKPIDPNQDFLVVTNNYRASGGGSFPGLDGKNIVVDAPDANRDVVNNYILDQKTINPSADQNWSIAPINDKVHVVFDSSPLAKDFAAQTKNIKYVGDDAANPGFAKYQLNLADNGTGNNGNASDNQPLEANHTYDGDFSYNADNSYGPATGTATVNGNLTINGGHDITLQNLVVNGNITIDTNETARLTHIKVTGKITIRNVADHSFHASDVTSNGLDITDPNGAHVDVANSNLGTVTLAPDSATGSINLTGNFGTSPVVITKSVPVTVGASVQELRVQSPAAITLDQGASISIFNVKSNNVTVAAKPGVSILGTVKQVTTSPSVQVPSALSGISSSSSSSYPITGGGGGGGSTVTPSVPGTTAKQDEPAKKDDSTTNKDDSATKPDGNGRTNQQPNPAFKDIAPVAWAKDAIESLAQKGIIRGTDSTGQKFSPLKQVTRAEFITMLVKALGMMDDNATASFGDVKPGQWHYKAIASATANKLVSGVAHGQFAPDRQITREEMATMMANALKVTSGKKATDRSASIAKFKDAGKIAPYAKDAVALLTQEGIAHGITDNTFAPKSKANRAEAAVFIKKMLDLQ